MNKILKELGLNATETDVYLALLPIGKASASIIAYQSDHDRGTVRYACKKLVKKGLLNSEKKGAKTLYYLESPFKLLFLLEEEKRQLQKKEDTIHRAITQLNESMDPNTILPKVRFYHGIPGLKVSYGHILESAKKEKISTAFFSEKVIKPELLNYFLEKYQKCLIKQRGIHNKHITLDTLENRKYKEEGEKIFNEMRFLDEKNMPKLDIGIMMSGSTVHYTGYNDSSMFALVIENKKISNMFHSLFEVLWSISKE